MPSLCGGLPVLSLVTLLCGIPAITEQDQCTAFSNVGSVVQLGSSFQVYCIFSRNFKDLCARPTIHVDLKEISSRKEHNSTTLSINISNITENRTYTCKCGTELCGFDLGTGYPPDVPQNLTCIQKAESGNVTCTWKKGRETYLQTTSILWVKTQAYNSTKVIALPGLDNVTFPVFESQGQYTVWVNSSNKLGSVVSSYLNFTLNDIVRPMPPNITRMECSSSHCILHWEDRQNSLLLQFQYRMVWGNWISHSFNASKNRSWHIPGLEPVTVYEIQARCKSGPARGVWSEWSPVITTKTDEAVPLKKLDVWYTESQKKSLIVLWKELNESEARGKILWYKLQVQDLRKGSTSEHIINTTKGWPISCSCCNITLSAYNSKGPSPPAHMTIPLLAQHALSPRNVSYTHVNNYSIAISWQKPASAGPVSGYVLEWRQANRREQSLRWLRVDRDQLHAVITENIQPGECYQGAVYALDEHMMGKAEFVDVSTWESVPTKGPALQENVVGGRVTVSWEEIPWEHQRGCLKSYTIYLKRGGENFTKYGPIDPSVRNYSITSGLRPGEHHTLWMTGRTAAGEGPRGEMKVFYLQQEEQQEALILTAGISTFLVCLVVMSLCQIPSVRQRVSACCFCLMPDIIPDPANSKWAKECAAVKGQMMLDYKMCLSDSTLSEEEPHTVEVQECQETWPSKNPELSRILPPEKTSTNLQLLLQPSQSPSQELPLYQGQLSCPYIKSFSHESDSSERTQDSQNTEVTVDYISSNGLLPEGGEEVEEEDVLDFFPCPQSPFLEPMMSFGGKLTLDAVKIDCSDFLD